MAKARVARVEFGSQGHRLVGQLCLPEGSKLTSVLFIRGGAVTFPAAQTFNDWQAALANQHFASLFFDFPGSGGWSPGALTDNTLARRLEWSQAALEFLQKRQPSTKVVVIGSSMGAPQAVALAAARPDLVKGVIVSCGGLYSREAEDKPFGSALSQVLRQDQSYDQSPTVEHMKGLQIPFLVFYAEHDEIIPRAVQDLYRTTPKIIDYRVLRGVGHSYLSPAGAAEERARHKVYQASGDFIDRIDRTI